MSVEERLEALELRLLATEDQLEIIRLLNSYGPLVDSGESQAARTRGNWPDHRQLHHGRRPVED